MDNFLLFNKQNQLLTGVAKSECLEEQRDWLIDNLVVNEVSRLTLTLEQPEGTTQIELFFDEEGRYQVNQEFAERGSVLNESAARAHV